MASATRKEIATERVSAGGRTYFFDIKEAADGTPYLVISESRHSEDGWEHDRVMVFEEYFDSFQQAFERAAQSLRAPKKAYTVEAVRRGHPRPTSRAAAQQGRPVPEWKRLRPRAGTSWSSKDDGALLADFDAGLPLEEIARRQGRGVFAIEVRLHKLGRIVANK
jgi:hypothetical protein